ncbi:hypothetical protein BDV59DRAFT_35561 [Aspergillus ambiguus]|uniref:uncharacterized protein n=1 Tax=Aspergillus ambiguus TaxID=176160 RepID=UPI003CCC9535
MVPIKPLRHLSSTSLLSCFSAHPSLSPSRGLLLLLLSILLGLIVVLSYPDQPRPLTGVGQPVCLALSFFVPLTSPTLPIPLPPPPPPPLFLFLPCTPRE